MARYHVSIDTVTGEQTSTPFTAEEEAAADSIPPTPKTFSFLDFMDLFTDAEKDAIVSSTDVNVELFRLMASGAKEITIADPRTSQGLDVLVSKGLITADRAAAIRAAMQ